ncbi:MAG: hypothetical protein GY760_25840 [Deltaproteobacteria bacterium]|nr:hypothetical protein [Deltaproteobacteria bacterium]
MTAQINDIIIYNDTNYSISKIDGPKIFSPMDYGFDLTCNSTACAKGYQLILEINKDKLILKDVYLSHKYHDRLRLKYGKYQSNVNGLEEINGYKFGFDSVLRYPEICINFTGYIILTNEFIEEFSINGGLQAFWKYKSIYEFQFSNGNLINITKGEGRTKATTYNYYLSPLKRTLFCS